MKFKEKKDAQISVRMTPIERCLIKSKADAVGMSLSRYMVECAKGTKIKTLTTEEKKAYTHLAKFHTNFTRISNIFKKGSPISDEVLLVAEEIKSYLKVLKNGK